MLPPIRNDLKIYPGPATTAGLPTWTLHDPIRNTFFNLGQLHVELLRRWGSGDPQAMCNSINNETAVHCEAADIDGLTQFLSAQLLLESSSAEDVEKLLQRKQAAKQGIGNWLLHHYLFFRVPLVHPDAFLQRTLTWVKPFYSASAALWLVVVLLLGLFLVSRQWNSFISTFDYFFSVQGAVIFTLSLTLTKLVHELGHAYTCKYYGLKVPAMGVAFLVMWPVAYTDTTDAWRLTSRRARMAIGAAGMLAELGLAGIATLAWSFLPDGPVRSAAFFVAAVSWIMTLAINSNPFMKWDGYYLFSDWLGIDNLQERAFALARWRMRKAVLGVDHAPPEIFPPRMQRTLLIYAYGTWIYRSILFLGIAFLVYEMFFKVAGIFLLCVELVWFLGKPIYRELSEWYTLRESMSWNLRSIRSAIILIVLVALLVVPWDSRVNLPAVYEPVQTAKIFAPFEARMQKKYVDQDQRVAAGEMLFRLQAPDLEFEHQQNALRSRSLELQLSRQSSNAVLLEYQHVLMRRLAETRAAQTGSEEGLQRLDLTAPFAGHISELADALTVGRWVGRDLVLARLVSETMHITAYLDEESLYRLKIGVRGRFYPEDASQPPFDVVLTQIDRSPVTVLDEPYSASVYGGGVAVMQGRQGEMMLHEARYRIHAQVDGDGVLRQRVLRGEVQLQGDATSILERIWRSVSAVLIRESGF